MRDEAFDQLRDPSPARSTGDEIRLILDRLQRVGDRDRKAARLHESMVIFGVVNRPGFVGGSEP